MPTTQTAAQKTARRKLASELSNLSKACKIMEYSRQQFYEIRRIFQTYGAEGLPDQFPRARNPHPNRVSKKPRKPFWITVWNIRLMAVFRLTFPQ